MLVCFMWNCWELFGVEDIATEIVRTNLEQVVVMLVVFTVTVSYLVVLPRTFLRKMSAYSSETFILIY